LATGVLNIRRTSHVKFVIESRRQAGPNGRPIGVIARDKTVMKRKGKRPVLPEKSRRELVAALKPVDKATLGREEADYFGILREIKPDIVCVGYDQNDIKKTVERIDRKSVV